jgi:hypothetical protein
MMHGVERIKAAVRGDLQDGGRRVERAINRSHAFAVPTAAEPEGTLAAVPGAAEFCVVKPPGHQFRRV